MSEKRFNLDKFCDFTVKVGMIFAVWSGIFIILFILISSLLGWF